MYVKINHDLVTNNCWGYYSAGVYKNGEEISISSFAPDTLFRIVQNGYEKDAITPLRGNYESLATDSAISTTSFVEKSILVPAHPKFKLK